MTQTTAVETTPFTQNLLRTLAATIPAQPDETEAEYAERFTAAATAWAGFRPRDTVEQMLAAQIVGAHYAALDSLARAAETEDDMKAERLRRSHATMIRAMRDTMRLLEIHQKRPADTEAVAAIAPIAPPRRRPAEEKSTQHPIQREKPRPGPKKHPSKMTDEELEAAKDAIRTECAVALLDPKHPDHREARRMLPEILPGVVIPESWLEDDNLMTA
jgi:hypothetical protein